MGNYNEALVKYKEVEKLRIDTLSKTHPDTVNTQYNIAVCFHDMGNYNEALVKYKEVEKLRIDILGKTHPDTVNTQRNMAICLKDIKHI